MKWTFEQLKTFKKVAELGTMTAAAEALDFTPGAVSQQMAALQSGLERPLFAKDGRGVSLTDTGLTLLGFARTLLEEERKAAAALSGPQSEQRMVVSVGVFGSAAVWAVRPAIENLRSSAPQLLIQAVEIDVERMPEAVLDGHVDIALGLSYPDAPHPPQRGLVSRILHTEPFVMVLPSAAGGQALSENLVDFANATDWILPPVDSYFGRACRFACAKAGIEPKVRHIVTDTAVSIALAESGVGITLASPLMMVLRPTSSQLSVLPGDSGRNVIAMMRSSTTARVSVLTVQSALADAFALRSGSTPPPLPSG
ncbi:LysR family transcriptional regulator [Paenarthrobacter histidinolovorans]|uniref:LysR family transcriptional regulator n=1 Tax=Paenarthrobacter histidinolovorans TaxID=43664 RepID=UPI00166DF765|nr:LysR family transcriptional regulator [Paenarthrobacter histidinolovorans]GGJ40417.1 LysR family transcriptional regulator [Paenarthrobacter histidinolovorans]